MALAVASSTSVGPSQPYIVLAAPAGVVSGDLLIAYHWLDNDGSLFNMTAPSGWRAINSVGGSSFGYAKSWYKWATGSEPSTYTFGGTSGADGLLCICRVTGAISQSAVTIQGNIGDSFNTTNHVAPAVSSANTDILVIGLWAGVVNALCTWTLPAGFTSRGLSLTTQSLYMQGVVGSKAGAPGSNGPYTGTSSVWNGFGFGDLTGTVLISQSAAGVLGAAFGASAGFAATAVVAGGAGILPSISVIHQIDWAGNGSYGDTGDNVSQRVLSSQTITINYGRDTSRALSPIKPGTVTGYALDNTSRDYSPDYVSGPLFGKLNPARPNQINVTYSGQSFTLWRGHLDDFDIDPTPGIQRLNITCLDSLADMNGQVSTPLYTGIRSGDAINYILDGIGWPSTMRDIDPGVSVFRHWWEDGTEAWTAIGKVLNSEGPPSFVTIDSTNGNVVFRDRHHRIRLPASLNVQTTFRNSGADPRFTWPLAYSAGWKDVINQVNFTVNERAAIDPAPVWTTDATFIFTANEVKSIIATATEPFYNAILPKAGTDFILGSGSIRVSISRDSGQSVQILLSESAGAPALITGLQLRANSVPIKSTYTIQSSDSTSIGAFGVKTFPDDAPWAAQGDAQAIADVIVAWRSQRLPTVGVRLTGGTATILGQQLTRDLSDRVHVTDTVQTGLDSDFFIEQIQHTIHGAGNKILETSFGCEKATTPLDSAATAFIFGSSTNGKFGTGLFGH